MTGNPETTNPSTWLGLIAQSQRFFQADEHQENACEKLNEFLSINFKQLEAEADCLSSQQFDWVYQKVQVILAELSPGLVTRIEALALTRLSPKKEPGSLTDSPTAAAVRAAINERVREELRAGLDRWVQDPDSSGSKAEAASRILKAWEEESSSLSLAPLHLSSLPPEIGELWALQELNLLNNQLQELPPEIGKLKKLERLVLSRNKLSSLPPELGKLTDLKELDLGSNCLRTLPSEIGNLRKLEQLGLFPNQIESLPPEIGNLRDLQKLDLRHNRLLRLPKEFKELQALRELKLTGNSLVGFPLEITELKALEELELIATNIRTLPSQIGNLIHLRTLGLSSNGLKELPSEFEKLKSLTFLGLDHNGIKEFPVVIGELESLKSLAINNNWLKTLPPEIGKLKALEQFSASNNKLTTLPSEFWSLESLQGLHLGFNLFERLSPEIGTLRALKDLSLSRNLLEGLPSEIGTLQSLERLLLCQNRLKSLPHEVGNLESLSLLSLYENKLETLPAEIGDLSHLSEFYIWDNPSLSSLPLNFGNLALITHLSIGNTGIPESELNAMLAACKFKRDNLAGEGLSSHLELWKSVARFEKGEEPDLSFIRNFPLLSSSELSQSTIYDWLIRLEKAQDFRSAQRPLAQRVCRILASLKDNHSFRSAFFDQVSANLVNCQDRAAMALNEVYTSWKIESLAGNTDPRSLETKVRLLVGLAKTFALRKELAERVAEHSADKGESVEIFLYYETRLREPLGLVTAIEDMTYSDIGKRDWLPIEEIQEAVEARYLDELLDLSAFVELAEAHMPETLEAPLPHTGAIMDPYAEMERLEALCDRGELSSEAFLKATNELMLWQRNQGTDAEKRRARQEWALKLLQEPQGAKQADKLGW